MILSPANVTEENLSHEANAIAERLDIDSLEEAFRFPKYFQIENVRSCNARCPFCAIDQWDKTVPRMKEPLFESIVEQLTPHADWVECVALQRAGEPLLDKQLAPRIRKLKDAGIKRVNLSTNASLLDEKRARALLESGLDEILFSIDSMDKAKFEAARVGLTFEIVHENIVRYFELRDEIAPDSMIRVRGVVLMDLSTHEGRAELRDWEDYWKPFGKPQDRIYMKQLHNWGNQVEVEELLPQYGDIYHPCIMPWSTLHVTTAGKVALCGQDFDAKVELGDLTRQTIEEVWRGQVLDQIRKIHASGNRNDIDFCRGCRLWDLEFSIEKKIDLGIEADAA